MLSAIQIQSEEEALKNSVRGQYRGRQGRRHRDRGLPQDAGGQARQHHRDLRRAEAHHRQLALGRRAVLPAHRQGARRKRTEIAIKFKQAPFAMFRDTPVDKLSQNYLGHLAPSRTRASTLQFNAKVPGPAIDDRRRRDEVPLQGLLQGRAVDRLRDADLRLHDRRRHPVPARRQRRGRLAGGAAVPRRLEEGRRQGA